MRELTSYELSAVSGGILPVVFALVAIDLALQGLFIFQVVFSNSSNR